VLQRYKKKELYAMGMLLSEDEARRYATEAQRAMVQAIYVCTSIEALESFQQFISATQHDVASPYCGLVQDMRADRIDVLEFDADQLQDQLHRCRLRTGFVAVDSGGPEQRVQKIEEFLAGLTP
jgi:alkanesulfonate monooxygenase SsuD/methylene tetrahydromethanopterin reductase-like flavin-dependent oxidoreductase (luciferase family)